MAVCKGAWAGNDGTKDDVLLICEYVVRVTSSTLDCMCSKCDTKSLDKNFGAYRGYISNKRTWWFI
ncbi:hypothetical protein C8N31_110146 [Sulfitobacter mediterraneus]|uniref:Uncharacterized protein n=1 Tax=Sulfitobacter mediterraneus TaxID=83219 RepID=A0A2T6CBK2_9RHOB|nr:hypothetical protein C8N31_110146 [Sulfitobacter mediterraneus]